VRSTYLFIDSWGMIRLPYWSNAAGDLKEEADRFEALNPALGKTGFEQ